MLAPCGLITAGESLNVEFKSSAGWNYKGQVKDPKLEHLIVKTVAGLMNAEGGTLLVGVDDHGHVLGLEPDYRTLGKPNRDGYELFLTQLLDVNLSGAALALARISFNELDSQDVCRVDIAASAQPVFTRPVDGRQHSEFWAQIGNSTRQLIGTDMSQYQREHSELAAKPPTANRSPGLSSNILDLVRQVRLLPELNPSLARH